MDDQDRTIEVTATATRTAPPDEAVIRVGANVSAADAVTARQQVAEAVSMMRDAFSELGVEDEQIRTDEYSIYYESPYEYGPPEAANADAAQRATQILAVTSGPSAVGEVIDTAVANGANQVRDVEFRLSSEVRNRLRTTALEAVMATARKQAETIATSADLSIESVRTVETDASENRFDQQLALDTSQGGETTVVDAPSVGVVARVTVTYEVNN